MRRRIALVAAVLLIAAAASLVAVTLASAGHAAPERQAHRLLSQFRGHAESGSGVEAHDAHTGRRLQSRHHRS